MSDDLYTLIKKGISFNSLGQLEKAITQYDKALIMDPGNIVALHHKEIALINLKKKYEEAILKFGKFKHKKSKNKKVLKNKKPKVKEIKKKKHWWSWR